MHATLPPSQAITWYRSPLPPGEMKALHVRSDLRGAVQSVGYLGVLVATGLAAAWAVGHLAWPWVVLLVFLHGTCFAFQVNAVHELGHGTVFKTKALNAFFVRIFSFLGWINFKLFEASHARHHRYTLHQPDDLEVVLPMKVLVKDFFRQGFMDWTTPWHNLEYTCRIAVGRFQGEWEQRLFPPGSPEARESISWARTLLAGHFSILMFALAFHLWMIPVLITLAPCYGKWLLFLCNNTQHIGLQDSVSDFRLCCRTLTLNPGVQFLYWHMNFHTEHHMYAAVPCYRLGRLHRLIKHDLPPCPHGLVATWREIASILEIQKVDPAYQHVVHLPTRVTPVAS